ncbi:MAG: PEP-CTERM sorting domain-containing protein [Syntrophobacteraceae bacterium]
MRNLKKIKISITMSSALLLVFLLAPGASALTITIDAGSLPTTSGITWTLGTNYWTGSVPYNGNLSPSDVAAIVGASPLTSLYKSNVGTGEEARPFSDSYATAFFNEPLDPADATISYTGGSAISGYSPLYLIVKDGASHAPPWYIFKISDYWNGTDTIELLNFWSGGGAISHVEIDGYRNAVPEPTTLLLLGSGMVGLIVLRRRFRK